MGFGAIRRVATTTAVAAVALVCAQAMSVAFQVVQLEEQRPTDEHTSIADDKTEPKTRPSSFALEEALFDVFFERGIIASNAPAAVVFSSKEAARVFARSLKEASRGGITAFVEITCQCADNLPAWRGGVKAVSWRVVSVKSKQTLGSGEMTLKKAAVTKEKRSSVYVLGLEIADEIYETIRK